MSWKKWKLAFFDRILTRFGRIKKKDYKIPVLTVPELALKTLWRPNPCRFFRFSTVHGHGQSMAMDSPWPWTVHGHCADFAIWLLQKEIAQTISPGGEKKKESSSKALTDVKK